MQPQKLEKPGHGAAMMEVDPQAALPKAALQHGDGTADGSVGKKEHSGSDAASSCRATRAAVETSKGSAALHSGSRGTQSGPTAAAAEQGMRTMLIRIHYRMVQPTSGLTFWGAYAHTDNQVQHSPEPVKADHVTHLHI